MPGRPRTPIGTFGAVNVRRTGKSVLAETRVRDPDGQLRRVPASAASAAAARRRLKEKLVARDARGHGGVLRASSSFGELAREMDYASGRSPAFLDTYQHLVDACARLVASGRLGRTGPEAVAARWWTTVHGFIGLELAHHFENFDDPVKDVLEPMAVNLMVGLGDQPRKVRASLRVGGQP